MLNPLAVESRKHLGSMAVLSCSVVIATRNRSGPMVETIATLGQQSRSPLELIVIDSSTDDLTESLVKSAEASLPFPVLYQRTSIASAAIQRNMGVDLAQGDIVCFVDDDVVLEPAFLNEIIGLFEADTACAVGGVSGTIINQVYAQPSRLNRFFLGLCVGDWSGNYAGRLVGPGVNFLPADSPDSVKPVDWLNTTGTAYRREVLAAHRFDKAFQGYSFMEDVHLSARVAKTHRLLNTSRARFIHKDLGKHTHKDWAALGESMVMNRYAVMKHVLGRNSVTSYLQLFAYEVLYCTLASLRGGINRKSLGLTWNLQRGKARGFQKVITGDVVDFETAPGGKR